MLQAAALQLNSVAVIAREAATAIIAHPRLATMVGVIGITVGVIATLVCGSKCCGGNNKRCGNNRWSRSLGDTCHVA
jgi:hypothetical protein